VIDAIADSNYYVYDIFCSDVEERTRFNWSGKWEIIGMYDLFECF